MSTVSVSFVTTGKVVNVESWVTVGGKRVDLDEGATSLPPGTYEFKWLFMGDVAAAVTYTIDAEDAVTGTRPCVVGPYPIPHGKERLSSGKYKPAGYVKRFIRA